MAKRPQSRRRKLSPPSELDILGTLVEIRRDKGISTREVARRMRVTSPAVSQLELGHRRGHSITLERLLRYANAIGAEIHVALQPPPPEFNQ